MKISLKAGKAVRRKRLTSAIEFLMYCITPYLRGKQAKKCRGKFIVLNLR